MLAFISNCFGQEVTVSGIATDSNNGAFAIEIVVNDVLAKLTGDDPKDVRAKYLKLCNDPRIVVRTDSTGVFTIKARETDSLFFKSYGHIKEAHLVRDLIKREKILIRLQPETNPQTD